MGSKNWLNVGSRERKSSQFTKIDIRAKNPQNITTQTAGAEKIQPKEGFSVIQDAFRIDPPEPQR